MEKKKANLKRKADKHPSPIKEKSKKEKNKSRSIVKNLNEKEEHLIKESSKIEKQKDIKLVTKESNGNNIIENNDIKVNKEFSNSSFKQINIYSWNVNGLRSVIQKGLLDEFIKSENPDILCLNETKIDEKNLEKLKLCDLYKESYSSFWNCSDKAGYSGVCILSKIKPLKIIKGIGIEKHDSEGRVITLEFDSFYLVSAYIPNAGEGLKRLSYRTNEWDYDFREFLQNLRNKKNVILGGDMNVAHFEIDISNPKGNKKSAGFTLEERNEFTKLLDLGWIDTFRAKYPDKVQYTYWSARFKSREQNKGWRLDYFVINKESETNFTDSEILDCYLGSDHCPIKLIYQM